jgi:hypothetical protein
MGGAGPKTSTILESLLKEGIEVESCIPDEPTLEEVFASVIEDGRRGASL